MSELYTKVYLINVEPDKGFEGKAVYAWIPKELAIIGNIIKLRNYYEWKVEHVFNTKDIEGLEEGDMKYMDFFVLQVNRRAIYG